jgi:NAD(P)-dependent dehydrogenase (short-subunit alcohol dehydrogenase family)
MANKVALVTGSSGIGAAVARKLAEEGAAVCVVGIDGPQVSALAAQLAADGHRAVGIEADLRSTEQTDTAFAACTEHLGAPNVVVAVAGGSGRQFGDGPIHELSLEAWRATFELNATPVMSTARAAVRAMAGAGGSLVIVSSVLAVSPAPPRFETHSYAAAKGAALALVTSLASSYAPNGVRVNAVLPGATDTPMAARAAANEEIMSYLQAKQPLTRGMVSAEDVADAVVFLAGNGAQAITGQHIAVDGGWTVTQAT